MSALGRRDAVRRLLAPRSTAIVVAGLGGTAYDLAAAGDNPLDFPLWGAMGGAAAVGLGLALAQPDRPIIVVTGDGEMLMGLSTFATIGMRQPPNLRIVVLDNERFGETGNQPTHTAAGVDLALVARGCAIARVETISTVEAIDRLAATVHQAGGGPLVAVIKIAPGSEPAALPPRDGPFLTHRIRTALLGSTRALDD